MWVKLQGQLCTSSNYFGSCHVDIIWEVFISHNSICVFSVFWYFWYTERKCSRTWSLISVSYLLRIKHFLNLQSPKLFLNSFILLHIDYHEEIEETQKKNFFKQLERILESTIQKRCQNIYGWTIWCSISWTFHNTIYSGPHYLTLNVNV